MIKNILLIIVSVLFSLGVVETVLKAMNFNSLSSFYPRYKTQDYTSHEQSQYTFSNNLPMVMKKNYTVYQADLSNRPILSKLTTDKYGFRNDKQFENIKNFDTLFVGDSVSFGYSVDDNETFVSKYIKKTKEKVYNLSVPNIGPASYMYLIDEFLKKNTVKTINIMWYNANDYNNLNNSYWKSMYYGKIPSAEKIIRKDIINKSVVYPEFMFYPILKQSSLALLMHNIFSKNNKKEFSRGEYINMKNLLISYLRDGINLNLNNQKITDSLNELKTFKEVTNNKEINSILEKLEQKYKNNDRDDLYELTKKLVITMHKYDMNPVSEKHGMSLSIYINSHLGYGSNNKLEDGYDGIVKSMINILENTKKFITKKEVNVALTLLYNYKKINNEKINALNQLLNKISLNFKSTNLSNISINDKLNIFIGYLYSLKKLGHDVNIYTYTGEHSLKTKDNKALCNTADIVNIQCINLVPSLRKYYSLKENRLNSLYLDASHFNEKGHDFILKQILHDR